MPARMTRFSSAIRYRKAAETMRAEDAAELLEARVVVGDGAVDGPLGDHDPDADRDHDRRVPEREPESDAERPLALVHQLAGRVVDRRDVIGVERMAKPERVCEAGYADPEALVVGGHDEQDEHREAEDVQRDHGEHQAALRRSLRRELRNDLHQIADDPKPPMDDRRLRGTHRWPV